MMYLFLFTQIFICTSLIMQNKKHKHVTVLEKHSYVHHSVHSWFFVGFFLIVHSHVASLSYVSCQFSQIFSSNCASCNLNLCQFFHSVISSMIIRYWSFVCDSALPQFPVIAFLPVTDSILTR